MRTIELASGVMHYDVQGSGDALLLIPGFASGAWSWSWQTPELARSFKVITFDPLGIGSSTINEGVTVSIEAIADDVASLMEALEIVTAHILGISFGGFVAQEFAVRYPHRIRRLVLASTSFGGPNHVAPAMPVLAAFASTDGLNTAERIRKYMTVAFTPEFVEAHGETVDCFCRLREECFVPREVYMQQLQAALSYNMQEEVSAIAAKTLVITGENDVVVPAENSRNLASALPNSRLATISGAGHMAFVEKADEFNRIVTEFLKTD
jgi:pimeloyl-ACP methyl ester carboxylesterase